MFTPEQVKGKLKNLAGKNNADARLLMRIFMMDRILERLSVSAYKDNFIIKGGILVTSMLGISMRSTMDIDASLKNLNLSAEDAKRIVNDIIAIDLNDGVKFEIKNVSQIMDMMEYPGIRIDLESIMGGIVTPLKMDISTGDAITPSAIMYTYNLLLDNRDISLWAYNLETILAEKIQTILARSVFNTRMRDFYDIYALYKAYQNQIDFDNLKKAFYATSAHRGTTNILENAKSNIESISKDQGLKKLWEQYKNKFSYATEIPFDGVIQCVNELLDRIAF